MVHPPSRLSSPFPQLLLGKPLQVGIDRAVVDGRRQLPLAGVELVEGGVVIVEPNIRVALPGSHPRQATLRVHRRLLPQPNVLRLTVPLLSPRRCAFPLDSVRLFSFLAHLTKAVLQVGRGGCGPRDVLQLLEHACVQQPGDLLFVFVVPVASEGRPFSEPPSVGC